MVTPAGNFALALHYARLTLAASTTWQGIVGAANAAEALPKIFDGEIDEHEADVRRPRAILSIGGEHSSEKGSTTGWSRQGTIELVFEIDPPDSYRARRRDARVWFFSLIGTIQGEMEVLAGKPGYLNIVAFKEVNTGRTAPEQDNGEEYWASIWNLTWLG